MVGFKPRASAQTPRGTKEDLRDELDQYQDQFESSVRRAADELSRLDSTRRVKRLCLIWQMQVLPRLRDALDQTNPVAALLDSWTLAVRMRAYLETGDGKAFFEPNQRIAIEAARDCERQVEKIAEIYLSPERLAEAKAKVAQLARDVPIRGEFSTPMIHVAQEAGGNDQIVKSLLTIPLAPFRALEGVDRTAESIRGFTVVAGRLTDVAQRMAADARLQLQLLMLEVEDLETVRSLTTSMQQFAESSKRLAATAEKLPGELRAQLTGAIDDANGKTSDLQATLRESRASAQEFEKASLAIATAGDSLADAALAIEKMADAFRGRASSSQATSEERGPPFNINDYTTMASAVGSSARELQALSNEIRGLSRDTQLDQRLAEVEGRMRAVVESSRSTGDQVVDHLAWRAFQLVLIGFALAAVYRFVIVRVLPKHA